MAWMLACQAEPESTRTADDLAARAIELEPTGAGFLNTLGLASYHAGDYRGAILEAYGETVTPPRSGKRGRPCKSYKVPPVGLTYATVHKPRSKGRVVKVEQRVVFGTAEAVGTALARSASSRAVNTSFVERQNGTDRNRNARKVRKSYCFSKDWSVHQAITFFTMYSYNFCWPRRVIAKAEHNAQGANPRFRILPGMTRPLATTSLPAWAVNVSGDRESKASGIGIRVERFLAGVFRQLRARESQPQRPLP
jgi:hypothetical protein